MTNKEILEKAIQKAIDGGWETPFTVRWREKWSYEPEFSRWWNGREYDDFDKIELNTIIFNHDFALSIWGMFPQWKIMATEQPIEVGNMLDINNLPNYMHHLQMMVISEDPIAYLGENI